MELQRGENNYDCFLASAAMVMNVPLSELKERLGHNGNEVVFLSIDEPYCFRGFHNQEIIDLAFLEGWSVMGIEAGPGLAPFKGNDPPYYLDMPKQRIKTYLDKFIGIIGGVGESTHAVAWDKKMIFDPSGSVYKLQDFKLNIREFWAFSKYVV